MKFFMKFIILDDWMTLSIMIYLDDSIVNLIDCFPFY